MDRRGFGNGLLATACSLAFARSAFALLTVLGSFSSAGLTAQQSTSSSTPALSAAPAIDGVMAAFQTHSLVGMCDWHGLAEQEDFYVDLIRDPRFAKDVRNVVVEFGGAAQQETIDRYTDGQEVPYEQLRRVWNETVGWIPTVTRLGYLNFFAQVRAVNQNLKPANRIHVWLGSPPIDWSKINTREDAVQVLHETDRYPANLIKSQILAKGKKALVIYGSAHFFEEGTIEGLVEASYPNAFFMVTPYIGFIEKKCSDSFEEATQKWPMRTLLTPVRGTVLQSQLQAPGCHFFPSVTFAANVTQAERTKAFADMENEASGVDGDALLYLGPAATLTESPITPDIYLDESFRSEINRRRMLMSGRPLTLSAPLMSPTYIHPWRVGPNSAEIVPLAFLRMIMSCAMRESVSDAKIDKNYGEQSPP